MATPIRLSLSLVVAALAFAAPAARAQDAVVVKQGGFEGASGHVTSGSGAIVLQGGRHYVSLGRDFAFDGAPDPKVALGRDGYQAETLLGALEANAGAQSYPLPEGFDPANFNEIWIWCERFDVPLGVARVE